MGRRALTVLDVQRQGDRLPRARSPADRVRQSTPVRPGYRRLSAYDLHCLRVETPARPIHLGILAVLDGRTLCDPAGRLRLAEVRREIDGRLAAVSELRQVVYRPPPLAGRPLWIDDPAFRIDRHVTDVELPPGSDDAALFGLTERLMAPLLDRSCPLWRMWFVTGLSDGRVGVLVVVHHALADGLTAMRLVGSLLRGPMSSSAPVPGHALVVAGPPPWSDLARDNIRTMIASAGRLLRPETWRMVVDVVRSSVRSASLARHALPSSLNAPVGPRRRLATLPLDRATAKRVARATGCGVNDVVLDLVAGGVRALFEARGEPVERMRPRAGVTIALFNPEHGAEAGNDIGTLLVALPLGASDPAVRLRLIAAERARARRSQMAFAEPVLRAWLGRSGVVRRALERQRLVNLAETYLPGPPVPIDVLGARVLDLLPIAPLSGNLGLSFVALSYAGGITVTVRADADRFPDLDVLSAAMERDWQALAGSVAR